MAYAVQICIADSHSIHFWTFALVGLVFILEMVDSSFYLGAFHSPCHTREVYEFQNNIVLNLAAIVGIVHTQKHIP